MLRGEFGGQLNIFEYSSKISDGVSTVSAIAKTSWSLSISNLFWNWAVFELLWIRKFVKISSTNLILDWPNCKRYLTQSSESIK